MAENIEGLPDVKGLESFLADGPGQDKGQQNAQTRNDKGQFIANQAGPDQNKNNALPNNTFDPGEQFKNKDGSLNVEALFQAYKGIQGGYTKATQDNKALSDQLKQIQEQFDLLRYQGPPQYAAPQNGNGDFDQQFIADPRKAVEGVAEQKARNMYILTQIEAVLQEEQLKNPEEYQERYAYVAALKNQYPHLVQSAPGVKKLFELADKARQEDLKRRAHQSVRYLYGEDGARKLESLLAGSSLPNNQNINPNLAYMPDGTLSNRSGADTGKKNLSTEIQAAAAKGDVDSVLQGTFAQLGLK